MSKLIRVATLKANGRRYVVRAFNVDTQQYKLWGEIVRSNGRSREHGADIVVDRAEVDVVETTMTTALHNELIAQALANDSNLRARWVRR